MFSTILSLIKHRASSAVMTRITASAAGMLVGIALSRTLGPAGLGSYSNILSFSVIVGTLLCLGNETPYNLRAANLPSTGGNLLLLVAAHAVVSIPAAWIIWLGLNLFGLAPDIPGVLFVLVASSFVLNQLTQPVVSGLQKQAWANLVMAFLLLLQALAIFGLSHTKTPLLPAAVFIYVVNLLFLYILSSWTYLKGKRINFRYRAAASEILRDGKHYWFATVAGVIRLRASIVIMGWYLQDSEIGNYQLMQTLTEVLYLIPVTLSTYVISSHNEGKRLFLESRSVLIVSSLTTVLAALSISVLLPFLIPTFYGDGFSNAIALGPIMMSGAIAFSIGKGIAAYFIKLGMPKVVTKIEISVSFLSVAGALFMISRQGLSGGVWAFVVTSWVSAIVYIVCIIRMRPRFAN